MGNVGCDDKKNSKEKTSYPIAYPALAARQRIFN